MAKWQGKSRKKPSSGRRWPSRKKRKSELGREPIETRVGPGKKVKVSARGGGEKIKLLSARFANVTDTNSGKSVRAEIHSVVENPANPHLARRDIITKGAIIETDIGKARVTGRPGQEGSINAILVEGNLKEKAEKKEEIEEIKEERPESKTVKEGKGLEEETEEIKKGMSED